MSAPLLRMESVNAFYGRFQALHGVSLEVGEGEAVVLLGANGAGKTTLLRTLSGLVKADGRITFDGRPILGRRPEWIVRCGVSHVPQGRGCFAERTSGWVRSPGGTRRASPGTSGTGTRCSPGSASGATSPPGR